jgi:hypothetical protein
MQLLPKVTRGLYTPMLNRDHLELFLCIPIFVKEKGRKSLRFVFNDFNFDFSKSTKLGKWLDIKAVVTDKVDWIVYYVASKGILLDTQRVSFKSKSKSATIWVKPDRKYFPRFTVTAVYLKGVDFVVGQIDIDISDKLENFVR